VAAMRIDAFRPATDFKENMDKWIQRFRSAKTVEGEEKVIIPGEPESAMERERMNNGIPLIEPVVNDLKELGNKFNVPL
jgi:LDH2 family malate/lactate/ureidoglycolate dehydrogenase